MNALRRGLPLAAWLAALLVGIVWFHLLGTGPLSPPPPEAAGWAGWAADRDPTIATVALLRLVALAFGWYLFATTVVGIVARLAPGARLVRITDVATIPPLRHLLGTALGASLATSLVVTSPAIACDDDARIAIVVDDPALDDPGRDDPAYDGNRPPIGGTRGPRPLPLRVFSGTHSLSNLSGTHSLSNLSGASVEHGAEQPTRDTSTHLVRSGESLWSIAVDVLRAGRADEPSDQAVARYWSELIETNRRHLADPGNPDLIFPGQVLDLPALSSSEPSAPVP